MMNQNYAILSSADLVNWQRLQTNHLAAGSLKITLPANATARFYRAQWLP
jgi:hypothetical protein